MLHTSNHGRKIVAFILMFTILLTTILPSIVLADNGADFTVTDHGRGNGNFPQLSASDGSDNYVAFCFDSDIPFNQAYNEYNFVQTRSALALATQDILNHSYPALTCSQIDAIWGTTDITKDEAYDATQLAIWQLTNGYNAPGGLLSENAQMLFEKLMTSQTSFWGVDISISINESSAVTTEVTSTESKFGPFQIEVEFAGAADSAIAAAGFDITAGSGDFGYTIIDGSDNQTSQLSPRTDYWLSYDKTVGFQADFTVVPNFNIKTTEVFELASPLGSGTVQPIIMVQTSSYPWNTPGLKANANPEDEDKLILTKKWTASQSGSIDYRCDDVLNDVTSNFAVYHYNGTSYDTTPVARISLSLSQAIAGKNYSERTGNSEIAGLVKGQKYVLVEEFDSSLVTIGFTSSSQVADETEDKFAINGTAITAETAASAKVDGSAASLGFLRSDDTSVYNLNNSAGAKTMPYLEFVYQDQTAINFLNEITLGSHEENKWFDKTTISVKKSFSHRADMGYFGTVTFCLFEKEALSGDFVKIDERTLPESKTVVFSKRLVIGREYVVIEKTIQEDGIVDDRKVVWDGGAEEYILLNSGTNVDLRISQPQYYLGKSFTAGMADITYNVQNGISGDTIPLDIVKKSNAGPVKLHLYYLDSQNQYRSAGYASVGSWNQNDEKLSPSDETGFKLEKGMQYLLLEEFQYKDEVINDLGLFCDDYCQEIEPCECINSTRTLSNDMTFSSNGVACEKVYVPDGQLGEVIAESSLIQIPENGFFVGLTFTAPSSLENVNISLMNSASEVANRSSCTCTPTIITVKKTHIVDGVASTDSSRQFHFTDNFGAFDLTANETATRYANHHDTGALIYNAAEELGPAITDSVYDEPKPGLFRHSWYRHSLSFDTHMFNGSSAIYAPKNETTGTISVTKANSNMPLKLMINFINEDLHCSELSTLPGTGAVVFQKFEPIRMSEISGAKFRILKWPSREVVIDSWTLDSSCEFKDDRNDRAYTYSPVLPNGTYIFEEIEAPAGYVLPVIQEYREVKVDINGLQSYNEAHYSLINYPVINFPVKPWERVVRVEKRETGTNAPLYYAEFTFRNNDLGTEYVMFMQWDFVDYITLPYGNYTITETKFPEGVYTGVTQNIVIDSTSPSQTNLLLTNTKNGRIIISKHDRKHSNLILAGATFEIRKNDENGELVRTVTTGSEPLQITDLPLGVYNFKEITAPPGYFLPNRTYTVSIQGYVTKTLHIFNDNEPVIYGWLEVQKKSSGGTNVGPATFELYDSNGYMVDTIITNANGYYKSPPLPIGNYRLVEVSAPAGHELNTDSINVTIKTNETTKIQPVNVADMGVITIHKTDGTSALNGAVFGFTNAAGDPIVITDFYGNQVNVHNGQSLLTEDAGTHTALSLPYGTYYVKEKSAPRGYAVSPTIMQFTVSRASSNNEVTVANDVNIGSITINKTDGISPLPGALFGFVDQTGNPVTVTDYDGNPINVANGQSQLTASGASHVAANLRAGMYYLKELQAPAGYRLSTTIYPLNVTASSPNQTLTVTNSTIPTGSVTIAKTGVSGPLEGAIFGFTDSSGNPIKVKDALGAFLNVVDGQSRLTAAGATHQTSGLPYGDYYVKEISAPVGYTLNPTVFKLTVNASTENPSSTISDSLIPSGSIVISKTDNEGSPLGGAMFGFVDKNGNSVIINDIFGNPVNVYNGQSILANNGGATHSATDLPYGKYYYKEIATPRGFVPDNSIHLITINGSSTNHLINVVNEPETPPQVPHGSITINKTDGSRPLDGALFGFVDQTGRPIIVTTVDGASLNIVNGASTLLSNGSTHSASRLPMGTYYVKEISAPEGYVLSNDIIKFNLTEAKKDATKSVANAPVPITPPTPPTPVNPGTPETPSKPEKPVVPDTPKQPSAVIISKTDATDAAPVPGAEITIWDSSKNEVFKGITDEKGQITFETPKPGTYTFRETYAPNDYEINETVFTFTVGENGKVTGTTGIKDYKTGTVVITKLDVIDGKEIPGATIRIEDSKGNTVFEQVSDEYGKIYFFPPAPGTYTFYETSSPDGYYLNEEKFTFTVDKNGKITSGVTYLEDVPYGTVVIRKTDVSDGKELKDAEITIWDDAGREVFHGMTDERGRVYFVSPGPGKYFFKETIAPNGYLINEETFSFSIDENFVITGATHIKDQHEQYIPKTGIPDLTSKLLAALALTMTSLMICVAFYPRKVKASKSKI